MQGWRGSRRRFLALLGAGLAGGLLHGPAVTAQRAAGRAGTAAPPGNLRIGMVLPVKLGGVQVDPLSQALAGEGARMGAEMAGEEFGGLASEKQYELEVLLSSAPDEEAAERAGRRLAGIEEVSALVGGFGVAEARVLSQVAQEKEVLFINIGSASESLRREAGPNTFHVEASASAYLDGLVGAFDDLPSRSWFLLHGDDPEGRELYRNAQAALAGRAGYVEAGSLVVADPSAHPAALDAIDESGAEAVLMLLDWRAQLDFLGRYEAEGLEAPITGFPFPVTQTRDYLTSVARAAPRSAVAKRISLWEAAGRSSEAALGEAFRARWGSPMDPHAWASYVAVGMLAEAALQAGSSSAEELAQELAGAASRMNLYKDGNASFRLDDNQLQQPLYAIRLDPDAAGPFDVVSRVEELLATRARWPADTSCAVERVSPTRKHAGDDHCSRVDDPP